MRLLVRLLALFSVAIGTSASADITANYVGQDAVTMKIEIASNGDVRGDISDQHSYFITHDGQGYMVQTGSGAPVVMRVDDIATVMAEQTQKLAPNIPADVDRIMPAFGLVKGDGIKIRGRQGIAYYMGSRAPADHPFIVISTDPALKPLAIAMKRQFDMSVAMMGHLLGKANPFQSTEDILATGAPLIFIGMELDTINSEPIPAAHFALPAKPLSLEGVRKNLGVEEVR
jgi:hypothetical protein